MLPFFQNAADELARKRLDQIETELTQNPDRYPAFAAALHELGETDCGTAYAQELAVEAYKRGFCDGVQVGLALCAG